MSSHSLNDLLQQPREQLLTTAATRGLGLRPHLQHDELVAEIATELLAHDEPVRTEGVLTVLPEGFGFVRMAERNFAPTAVDAYVSPNQIRTLNLQFGHRIEGPLRNPRGTERFHALTHVDRVQGLEPEQLGATVPFAARTPVPANRALLLPDDPIEHRTLRTLAPWQLGHRVLVHSCDDLPRAAFFSRLAAGIARAQPDAAIDLTLCLLEQRPEDVARVRNDLRDVPATVVHTEFAAPPENHVTLTNTALHRAMRQVEQGRDAVLMVDSLTALTRAQSRSGAPSGAWIQPGLDARAVLIGKRLLAAARQCQEGGSLTVIASVQGGSAGSIDAAIETEFGPYSSSDVCFEPELVATGHELPLDLLRTRTRREDDATARREQQRRAENLGTLAEQADPHQRATDWAALLNF